MYVLTLKKIDHVVAVGNKLEYSGGNTLVTVDTRPDVVFPVLTINIYEVEDVPEEIIKGPLYEVAETDKYIYTEEKGFENNKDFISLIELEKRVQELEEKIKNLQ